MPGVGFPGFLTPVQLTNKKPSQESQNPPHIQACAIWFAYFAKAQQQAPADGLPALPSPEEIKSFCRCGQGEMLLALVQQQLKFSLQEQHVPLFWSRLSKGGWSCSAMGLGRPGGEQLTAAADRSDEDRCLEEDQLASILCKALKDLSALVESHCQLLSQLGAQLLDAYQELASEEAAAATAVAATPTTLGSSPPTPRLSMLWSPMDITPAAVHGDTSGGIKSAPCLIPASVTKLGMLAQSHRTLARASIQAASSASLQGLLQLFFSQRIGMLKPLAATSSPSGGSCDGAEDDARAAPGVLASVGMAADVDSLMKDCWEADVREADPAWMSQVREVACSLHLLGLSTAAEEACTAVVYAHVQQMLDTLAKGVFDREVLPDAIAYIDSVPMQFLQLALAGPGQWTPPVKEEWRLRLSYLVFEGLGYVRISQMFDIIVDYPDSMPAVQDVAQCLEHTSLQPHLVAELSSAISQRLLHAGASASSIIHTYISTIKALSSIEPSGSLLAAVAEPIRRYLRGRPDAIKVLVAMITQGGADAGGEGSGPSLLEELQQASLAESQPADLSQGDPDEAILRAAEAEAAAGSVTGHAPAAAAAAAVTAGPAAVVSLTPVKKGTSKGSLHGTAAPAASKDIIGMLIGVFGSIDVFVNEYRSVMGAQLLTCSDYDCERALRTTELLKLRFGEPALHACEVMLKDVADSRRTNVSIHAAPALPAAAPTAMCTSEPDDMQPHGTPRHVHAAAAAATAAADPTAETPPCATAASDGQMELSNGGPSSSLKCSPELPLSEFSATILSHMFWPKPDEKDKEKEQEAKVALPAEACAVMKMYSERYQVLKTPRQLRWRPHQGVVEMDLVVGEVKVELRVSPLLATLLLQFREEEQLTAAQLALKVGLPQALVRRKVGFWVNKGVLQEHRQSKTDPSGTAAAATAVSRRRMVARAAGAGAAVGSTADSCPVYSRSLKLDPAFDGTTITDEGAEEDSPSSVAGPQDALLEVMSPYENYIMGMLTTYKQLPLDRLHHMLKLFVISPKFDKSVDQLAAYLSYLVSQGKVVFDNSLYRKPAAPRPASEN